jgi:hypothetical protein
VKSVQAVAGSVEARLLTLEVRTRDLLALLNEGGSAVEQLDAARVACEAALAHVLDGVQDVEDLTGVEREAAIQRLEVLVSLSAVTRERAAAERLALVGTQAQLRAERERLQALGPGPRTPGGTCDVSG